MIELMIDKDGSPIHSMEDWFTLAPPKKKEMHWVDGRSAKELAKAFFVSGDGGQLPSRLRDTFAAVTGLGDLQKVRVMPEFRIRFDPYKGEMRNADLACLLDFSHGRLVATVEAKADESFGLTVGTYLHKPRPARSNIPKRLDALAQALLSNPAPQLVEPLRYQLLHATGATLALAGQQQAARALLVIYEFVSPTCRDDYLERNALDLDNFMQAMGGQKISQLAPGAIAGPIQVRGNEYIPARVPLYVAKLSQHLP